MKKKILYLVTQSELGGAQRYILDLARNFKNEYEVTVAFGEQGNDGELAGLLDKAGVRCFVVPHLKRALSPISDPLTFFEIRKLYRELRPNIVHLSSSKISILASLAACRCFNKKDNFQPLVVYTAHGWVFNEPINILIRKFYFYMEKWTAKLKDKIICINKYDLNIAKEQLGIEEKKLSMIYHGIDTKQYAYLSKDEAKKKLFSYIPHAKIPDEKTILIGSIGNLYRTKGYYYLIKAMHYLVIDYGYNITTIVIGEGPQRKDLEERIIKFHPMDYNAMDGDVGNKIILAGRIPNAAELLPAFDFYLSTSLKEGFPYTILEAMGAGLPIVASKVGGIPDMINDNINGLLIEPRNSKPLAKLVSDLIKDPERRKRLAERAKHDADHLFKFNKMMQDTKKVYEG